MARRRILQLHEPSCGRLDFDDTSPRSRGVILYRSLQRRIGVYINAPDPITHFRWRTAVKQRRCGTDVAECLPEILSSLSTRNQRIVAAALPRFFVSERVVISSFAIGFDCSTRWPAPLRLRRFMVDIFSADRWSSSTVTPKRSELSENARRFSI